MKLLENMKKSISAASKQAQKKFDTTKIDLKIKSYLKDINDEYIKIGKMIYNSKSQKQPISDVKLNELCKNINMIYDKIQKLEKKSALIKYDKVEYKETESDIKSINYTTLNKKENDLKILRTEEGIKFLKFCSECNTGNNPESEICIKCGHKFN